MKSAEGELCESRSVERMQPKEMEQKEDLESVEESSGENVASPQGGKKWAAFMERGFLSGFRRRKTGREEILARFEKWLDETLEKEGPLEGVDEALIAETQGDHMARQQGLPGEQGDLYAAWSAITALTQEVKLQGRSFKALNDTLTPLSQLNGSLEEVASVYRETVKEWRHVAEQYSGALHGARKAWVQEAEARARQDLIQVFLDIREGLLIGWTAAEEGQSKLMQDAPSGWLSRRFAKKTAGPHPAQAIVQSLKKGYQMGLDRIEEAIGRMGVFEIPSRGLPFDPMTMTAVDIEQTEDQPDGMVLAVYRTGYLLEGQVLRPAQVKVARHSPRTQDFSQEA